MLVGLGDGQGLGCGGHLPRAPGQAGTRTELSGPSFFIRLQSEN